MPEGVCAQLQLQADITSWLFQRLLSPPLFPSLPGGIQPHSWLEVTLLQRSGLSSPSEKINQVKRSPLPFPTCPSACFLPESFAVPGGVRATETERMKTIC